MNSEFGRSQEPENPEPAVGYPVENPNAPIEAYQAPGESSEATRQDAAASAMGHVAIGRGGIFGRLLDRARNLLSDNDTQPQVTQHIEGVTARSITVVSGLEGGGRVEQSIINVTAQDIRVISSVTEDITIGDDGYLQIPTEATIERPEDPYKQ
jgi:hypothetical protein